MGFLPFAGGQNAWIGHARIGVARSLRLPAWYSLHSQSRRVGCRDGGCHEEQRVVELYVGVAQFEAFESVATLTVGRPEEVARCSAGVNDLLEYGAMLEAWEVQVLL